MLTTRLFHVKRAFLLAGLINILPTLLGHAYCVKCLFHVEQAMMNSVNSSNQRPLRIVVSRGTEFSCRESSIIILSD
jgi:hypothetical protein